jgi:predicted dinucleotide-binding enzyme
MGAGGKMGCRLTDNLMKHPNFAMRYVEVSEAGIARLAERGLTPTPQEEALAEADIVILALPDRILGSVAREIVPHGALVMMLDPAAPQATVCALLHGPEADISGASSAVAMYAPVTRSHQVTVEQMAILELWTPYQGKMEDTISLEAQWADASISYLMAL